MSRMRAPIALLMMLWLPLQAVTAVAMPFCRHALSTAVEQPSAHPDAQHHDHAGGQSEHGAAGHEAPTGGHVLSCTDCGACHLACAPVIAPTPVTLLPALLAARLPIAEPAKPHGFLPERLKRPPLAHA